MSNPFSDLQMQNESDVEQKLLLPLLSQEQPVGLGYNQSDYHTKPDIRKIRIGKGESSKLYFPDYIIVLTGLPCMVIEVKSPGEDLSEAIREGRLYSSELNADYSAGKNPCKYVVVTNGKELVLTSWDSENPVAKIEVAKVSSSNPDWNDFLEIISKDALEKHSDRIKKEIRGGARFVKPRFQLGGQTTQNELVKDNSFGSNLSLEYRALFNPERKEERKEVVKNAYVKSKKRESHVRPIDRLIKGLVTPSQKEAQTIKDSSNPKELLDKFEDIARLRNEICLLVGSVGSGKSTFTEYLRQVALSTEVKENTDWLYANLNNAPIEQDLIYKWLIEKIIQELKESYSDIDFSSREIIETIFASELKEFKKGPISILDEDTERYKEELFSKLKELDSDQQKKLGAMLKYLYADRNRLPVVVLDNSDKGNRDKQLLMFEVANWLRDKFNCFIFLPIRESTYDHYHNQPPLDTVIKDLVFRIDPPLLENVIQERFKYMVRSIESEKSIFHYYTSNNIKVQVKKEDVESYLRCIINALFQDAFFKKLLTGLAGRNIRKGIEVFLDICKSGYISEDFILKVKEKGGDFILPHHILTRILLRGKRKYYHDAHSRIKNLFDSDQEDTLPDPLVRLSILRWLEKRKKVKGPNDVLGYHKIETILKDLVALGHDEIRVLEEIRELVKAECLMTESQDVNIEDNETISITPKGTIHLDLLKNIDYLSTISEDTYFKNSQISKAISNNIKGDTENHLSKQSAFENSRYLISYLQNYKNQIIIAPEKFLPNGDLKDLVDLNEIEENLIQKFSNNPDVVDPIKIKETYPPGTKLDAEITGIQDYGLFVEFGENAVGFIDKKKIKIISSREDLSKYFKMGQVIKIKLGDYQEEHRKFDCKVVHTEMQKKLFE